MVLVVLAIGSLVILPVLRYTGTAARAGGRDIDDVLALYASEAGLTNVLTDLIDGKDALATGYSPPTTTVNGFDVSISVTTTATTTAPVPVYRYVDPGAGFGLASLPNQSSSFFRIDNFRPGSRARVNWAFTPQNQRWKVKLYEGEGPPGVADPVTIAADDFESGTFGGGTGWLFDWSVTGNANVTSTGGPFEGTFHMSLTGSDTAKRAVDLTGKTDVRVQFRAKADSFESGETATMSVSPDGVVFTVLRVWEDGEDDNVYRFEDIDITVATSSAFWIAFSANTSGVGDLFFVDDVKIVSRALPAPLAENSDTKGPGALLVDGGLITGGSYTFEFFNNSGTELVSAPSGTTGSDGETWVFLQAYKDYLVTATAGETSVSAYIRQVPGPTEPTTGQSVFTESWGP